jgi:hypothetical protein
MIASTMRGGRGGVGMGGEIMKLCDSIVRTLWHGVLLTRFDAATTCRGFDRCSRLFH